MQMISEHAGMLELFDRQRNHTDPAQISVKTNNKYSVSYTHLTLPTTPEV